MSSRFLELGLLFGAIAATACGEPPGPRADAAPLGRSGVQQVPLVPGVPAASRTVVNPFAGDDHAVNEGRRLYGWMNCSGCHFEGGGGIGPPLMDDAWIYGGRPDQIFDTIASGRPNGMPAYGDKLGPEDIWRIAAYVETLNPERGHTDEGAGREVGDNTEADSEPGQSRRAG